MAVAQLHSCDDEGLEDMQSENPAKRPQVRRVAACGLALSLVVAGVGAAADEALATPPSPSYTLSVIAGTGSSGTPTPGPAASSSLGQPEGIAVDTAGNMYVADTSNHVVEKITPDGTLSVIAGNGGYANPTVAGPATDTNLHEPISVAVDSSGNVYIADETDYTVDKVTPAGQLSIIAGVPGQSGPISMPGPGPATSTLLNSPAGVAVDARGNVYLSDWGYYTVDKVTPAGHLTVFAGSGNTQGLAPVPGPATNSPLYYPFGMAFDSAGNMYLANEYDNDVVKITAGGTLSIVAGLGPNVYSAPVPGPAADSPLNYPSAVTIDNLGNLYISDSYNYLIEKVTPHGTLSVIAGVGTNTAPTPGPAISSAVGTPYGIAVNSEGNVFYDDLGNIEIGELALSSSVPTAPVGLHASPGVGGTAALTFSPPLRTGNSPITGYQYSVDGGHTWHTVTVTVTGHGSTLTSTVAGLAAGRTYRIKLRAVNAVGAGPVGSVSGKVPALPKHKRHPKPWFVDPLSKGRRAHLPAVPKNPLTSHGKARLTKADYRAHNGHLAVPVGTVRGHQLGKGQAVQITSLFAFDSAKLTKPGRAILRRLAHSMRNVHRISCQGHADYAGALTHEVKLSRQRAAAVCTTLSRDLPGLHTHSVGYGPSQPVVIGGAAAQRSANRRVDIVIDR